MTEDCIVLSESYERPCIDTVFNGVKVHIMIDTGARFPVWTSGKKALLKAFPDAKLFKKNCSFSGFGGTVTADVYTFMLIFSKRITYPTMYAYVYEDASMLDLILSISAFHGMEMSFNYLDYKFRSVTFRVGDKDSFIRNLKFKMDENNRAMLVLATSDKVVDEDAANTAAAFRSEFQKG